MKTRIVLLLSYASIMMSAVFIPNYANLLGSSMIEIGLIGASYGLSLFLSSLIFSRASDKLGRKKFITTGLMLSAIAFMIQIFSTSPLMILLVRALAGIAIGMFTSPLIAYAYEKGDKMGSFSAYGSLGWAGGALLAGLIAQMIENLGFQNILLPFWGVFFMGSVLFLSAFVITMPLQEQGFTSQRDPLFPFKVIKKNSRVYLSAFLRNFGAYSIWIIFPLYLTELGASKLWIGILYFLNMGSQSLIMRKLDYLKETSLIKAGLLLSSIVFISFTLTPDYRWMIPLQIVLAFSYSFLYVGDLLFLTKRNPEKGVSIGILNSILGICIGFGPLLGGFISQIYGFKTVMILAGGLAFIGYLIMINEN